MAVLSRHAEAARRAAASLGGPGLVEVEELSNWAFGKWVKRANVVLLAAPGTSALAAEAVAAGVHVVSSADSPAEVRQLLEFDALARRRNVSVVAGAGLAPGLSCLLAAVAARRMDHVWELHVATLGTGGPACARRRHAALREPVEEWREGVWERKVAGGGRELVWFPGEGGADCYRVSRADTILVVRAFPGLRTATSRAAASRRDRLTSWMPMLRPPHPEGIVGALAVEVRGEREGRAETVLLGASGRPALVAGAVCATAAELAGKGQLRSGAGGLASLAVDPADVLAGLSGRGIVLAVFEGAGPTPAL